ncbi:MAG: hypothetical protein MHPSP_000833 [Paramarteilia canceri]
MKSLRKTYTELGIENNDANNENDLKETKLDLGSSGNIEQHDEGAYMLLQGNNLFWCIKKPCRLCSSTTRRTVEHVIMQCDFFRKSDYIDRQDEQGLVFDKSIRNFKLRQISSNSRVIILSTNRPVLLIIDKKNKFGLIIEVGISSMGYNKRCEFKKTGKYNLLAEEIKKIHSLYEVDVILMIWSWEENGVTRHPFLSKLIEITESIKGYIQSIILKITLDSFLSESCMIHTNLVDIDELVNTRDIDDAGLNNYSQDNITALTNGDTADVDDLNSFIEKENKITEMKNDPIISENDNVKSNLSSIDVNDDNINNNMNAYERDGEDGPAVEVKMKVSLKDM